MTTKRKQILVLPSNPQRAWFSEALQDFGRVRHGPHERVMDPTRPADADVQALVAEADLVIYRRLRAHRLYPTDGKFLCWEWTPLRHPLRWAHYYADPKGFFHEGSAEERFRNLPRRALPRLHKTGLWLSHLYEKLVDRSTADLIAQMIAPHRRHPHLVLVVLQVPDDDVIRYCAGDIRDPAGHVINYAKEAFGSMADILVKPHPVSPHLPESMTSALEGTIQLEPYCPIWPLLKMADLVVTVNSSCTLEALILGTPAVALGQSLTRCMDFAWAGETAPRDVSRMRHTPPWIEHGLSFLGFLGDRYGDWYPSTKCMRDEVTAQIGGP